MGPIEIPVGFRLERLRREMPRDKFRCGDSQVDSWLATKSWQNQKKRLSVTHVLMERSGVIAGFFTLAMGQVDFSELPIAITKSLPQRPLPIAVVAWLGVDQRFQGRRIGELTLALALQRSWNAGATFPFVAVVLDCISEAAKQFYQRYDFAEIPGQPFRLFLSAQLLDAMMRGDE